MELSVGSSPHRITVVDADMFTLFDIDSCSYHHTIITVKMFTGVVDAGMLKNGNICV